MLVKLLARQIPEYQDVINEGMKATLPPFQVGMISEVYKQLLDETAQCWISTREGKFEAVYVTRVEYDPAIGGKLFTVLSGYAPSGLTGSGSVLEGYETMKKFALSQGCDRIAFYTNNPEVEKYIGMFDLLWETRYYQFKLEEV